MKKFLYLCLFGTTLAGISAWAAGTERGWSGLFEKAPKYTVGQSVTINGTKGVVSALNDTDVVVKYAGGSVRYNTLTDGLINVDSGYAFEGTLEQSSSLIGKAVDGVVDGTKAIGSAIGDAASWTGDQLSSLVTLGDGKLTLGGSNLGLTVAGTAGSSVGAGVGVHVAGTTTGAAATVGKTTGAGLTTNIGGENSTAKLSTTFGDSSSGVKNTVSSSVDAKYLYTGDEMASITKFDGTEFEVSGTWTKVGDNQYTFTNSSGKMVSADTYFKSPSYSSPSLEGVSGTVTKVDGNNITIKGADGVEYIVDARDYESLTGSKVGDDVKVSKSAVADGANVTPSAIEQKVNANTGNSAAAVKTAAAKAVGPIEKAIVTNPAEYALQILQAYEATHQDDATKEITVKGAQALRDSQGDSSGSSVGSDKSLEATTISSAANTMVTLLKNNPMYINYLDESLCADKKGTDSYKECIQGYRKLFANTTALSGQMISEGSNAISSKFYDRINTFTSTNNSLGTGSLGAMSVINDAERYPYFEMVRGTALSAVQLGVKEARTFVELDIVDEEGENAQ